MKRRLPFAGATLALLLAACAPSAGAPGGSTANAGARPPVSASGAGLWFAPAPANPRDLLALAEPNAPWSHAAATTAVVQLSASSITAMSDADLTALITGLKRVGLPIALLTTALTPVSGCGTVLGSPDAGAAPTLLRRMKAAGATVRFLAMDRPGSTGTHCGLSAMEIATSVGAWSTSVRAVFPQVGIGDAEPLLETADASALADWVPAYATVTGSPLAFLHLDLEWSLSDWPVPVSQLETLARQTGTGFGVIDRGNVDDASDALWSTHAADRMAAVASAGVQVDSAIFESFATRSPRLLPETDSTTFTALLYRYAGTRSALTLDSPTPGSGGNHVLGGKLVDASGAAVRGATVDLTVRSLNAPGDVGQYSVTGTVPAGVDRAIVGIRVATEGADAGPADLVLYHAGYQEGAPGNERVPNPDFADGMANWGTVGLPTDAAMLHLQPSDRGSGQALHVADNPPKPLRLNSDAFSVTPGAAYTVSFSARLAPVSRGYFVVIFARGSEISRSILRFSPTVIHQSAVSDANGRLQWRLPDAAFPAEVDARYAGDQTRWPASATA